MKIDFDTSVTKLSGEQGSLKEYEGDVLLVVNTASACGFTPQYAGLEKLHQENAAGGLRVLGFPCNQFGKQEAGDSQEITQFCQKNYGVTFPMHEKVDVNGSDAHPLFDQLKTAAPGLLGSKGVKWNFTKFLVARDGTVLRRYAPKDTPASIEADIEAALKGS
ncbi:MAG: glutathione peroxidase [Bradymonadia bacterium]|jgi:glutathione peroxidase